MESLHIIGGNKLYGTINISGAKNSALKIMAATIIGSGKFLLSNVPQLVDVSNLCKLLQYCGVKIKRLPNQLEITIPQEPLLPVAPYDIVRKMRASFNVLGPFIAKYGHAKVSLPGGCAIGTRPVGLHLEGLKKFGANIEVVDGYIIAQAKKLVGAKIDFPFVSVGATEHLLMTACGINGETKLINCAKEPEIVDLANFLRAMGAIIEGDGTDIIHIKGSDNLGSTDYKIMPDRIETGSYIMTVATVGGKVKILNTDYELLGMCKDVFIKNELDIKLLSNGIEITSEGNNIKAINIETETFPGFATDLQASYMTMMCMSDGIAKIKENIFENRFMHVPELNRLGADITINGQEALVKGNIKFMGGQVMATDLRASMSLVMAALTTERKTVINRVYHLDRGFENLEGKLSACGANITRHN